MNESEYKSIMTAFKQRADEHGCITRDAFIESVGSTSHPELAGKIFDVFDKDGSNTMDVCSHHNACSLPLFYSLPRCVQLKEYLLMCGMTRAGTIEQRLEASFDLFDANGDGVLSKEEVRSILIMLVQQKMALARFQSTGRKTSPERETLDARTLASIDHVVDATFASVDTDKVCFFFLNALCGSLPSLLLVLVRLCLWTKERHHRQEGVHTGLCDAPRDLLILQAVLSFVLILFFTIPSCQTHAPPCVPLVVPPAKQIGCGGLPVTKPFSFGVFSTFLLSTLV